MLSRLILTLSILTWVLSLIPLSPRERLRQDDGHPQQFCEAKIVPFIDSSYDELSDYLNCMERTLVMKRECIAEKGIWTAKKRYILNVWDNEGVRYTEPSLKMMGIEAVKSSTPAPCRGYIKDCLNIIMSGTESDLIHYIEKTRAEHAALPPEAVAFPRTVTTSISSRTIRLSTVSPHLFTFVVLCSQPLSQRPWY